MQDGLWPLGVVSPAKLGRTCSATCFISALSTVSFVLVWQASSITPNYNEFTGFVFKLQANLDPRHRDRLAYVRVVSGRYEKGMKVRYNCRTLLVNDLASKCAICSWLVSCSPFLSCMPPARNHFISSMRARLGSFSPFVFRHVPGATQPYEGETSYAGTRTTTIRTGAGNRACEFSAGEKTRCEVYATKISRFAHSPFTSWSKGTWNGYFSVSSMFVPCKKCKLLQISIFIRIANFLVVVTLPRPYFNPLMVLYSIVQEAYPGDVIGINNPGHFAIGDTIFTGGTKVRFPGIPSFSPECFAYMRNPNPSKYKNYRKGLDQVKFDKRYYLSTLRNARYRALSYVMIRVDGSMPVRVFSPLRVRRLAVADYYYAPLAGSCSTKARCRCCGSGRMMGTATRF